MQWPWPAANGDCQVGRLAVVTNAATVIRRRVVLPALLVALAFALGHQIVYLIQYGANAGSALARTGHDGQWTFAVATIVSLATLLVIAAGVELRRLGARARSIGEQVGPRGSLSALALDIVPLFFAVLLLSLALFLVVENLEYVSAGLEAPGATLLISPVHQETLIVFELVSFAVALVAGLYRWRRDVLIELIELAGRQAPLRRPDLWSKWPAVIVAPTIIVRARPPGRAPPALAHI